MRGEARVVGDKDVVRGLIFVIPFAKGNDDFERDRATLKSGFEGINPKESLFSIFVLNFYRFEFMFITFFDKGNDLVNLQHRMLFKLRMVKGKQSIGFEFCDNRFFHSGASESQEMRGIAIPGIKEDGIKRDL